MVGRRCRESLSTLHCPALSEAGLNQTSLNTCRTFELWSHTEFFFVVVCFVGFFFSFFVPGWWKVNSYCESFSTVIGAGHVSIFFFSSRQTKVNQAGSVFQRLERRMVWLEWARLSHLVLQPHWITHLRFSWHKLCCLVQCINPENIV